MKFFEKFYGIRADSIFNFVCSGLNALILSPIRLLQEISKKAVYLKRKQLDTLFFISICVGLLLTGVECFVLYTKHSFSLFGGKIPLIVFLAGDAFMILIYAFFSTNKFSVYDNLSEYEIKRDLNLATNQKSRVSPSAPNNEVMPTKSMVQIAENETAPKDMNTPFGLSMGQLNDVANWLVNNDYFTATENQEILDLHEVADYQQRLKNGVEMLQNYQAEITRFSEEELNSLKHKLDAVTPPSKFIDKRYVDNILSILDSDEVALGEDDTACEIEDDLQI